MNPSALRRQLADIEALSARTRSDEEKIHKAAIKRHGALQKSIEGLRVKALTGSDEDELRYTSAIDELGKLAIVIGKSKAALAGV